MAGEGGDEVRILDQLVDVAYDGTTGHVAAGDLIDRNLHLRSGHCVKLSHKISDPCLLKDSLDADVVAFRGIERKELISRKVSLSVNNLLRYSIQRYHHSTDIFLDSLRRNILYRTVDDIPFL